ncbi:MAG: transcriptional regulator [Spirochaetota bacterium]
MGDLYTRFDQVFFERTRLSIVTLIEQRQSVSFNGLKQTLGTTDGALYTHLAKLIDAGYVTRRKELTGDTVQTVYSLTEQGSRAYHDYLAFLQEILQRRESASTEKGEPS